MLGAGLVKFCSLMQLSMVKWIKHIRRHIQIDFIHFSDVIMGTMASQITSLRIAYSTVYSGANHRKHQSSASLAFVRGIHRWTVNSLHKGPVTRKMFPFDDVIMHIIFIIKDSSKCTRVPIDNRYSVPFSFKTRTLLSLCIYIYHNNVKNLEKYAGPTHTLRSYQMFASHLFEIKLNLLSTTLLSGFQSSPGALNPLSTWKISRDWWT